MATQLGVKDSIELKKHVGLIHSTNFLSLLERKIANALLYNAYSRLREQSEHQIHIANLSEIIGYNSKDYKTIKKSLMSLLSTVLEWNILDNNKNSVWVASAMLSDAKIDGPICTYSYSNRMRELCYYPEFYARLNLQTVALFKSTYGIALYENCARYRNIKHTPWMSMDMYRKLMGVTDGKYIEFKNLNKRVIKPAITEVNNYSSIHVDVEFKKHGRIVTKIRFLISDKVKEVSHAGGLSNKLIDDFGVNCNQADSYIQTYGDEYIKEKIQLIEKSKPYKEGSIKNLSQYLKSALEQDYKPAKSSKENSYKLTLKNEKETKRRETIAALKEKQFKYLSDNVRCIITSISSSERKNILNGFEKYIKTTVYSSLYLKHGLEETLVRDKLVKFLRSRSPQILDDFCEAENHNITLPVDEL